MANLPTGTDTDRYIVCDQAEDEAVDPRKLMEQRQKLMNDIERLRAENESLKVLHNVSLSVRVCISVWTV